MKKNDLFNDEMCLNAHKNDTPDGLCGFAEKPGEVLTIDHEQVQTWQADFISANILSVTVGTNGTKGGDSGHGSRTILKLTNDCAAWYCNTVRDSDDGYLRGLELVLEGDTELMTFINGLEYAAKVLRKQMALQNDSQKLTIEDIASSVGRDPELFKNFYMSKIGYPIRTSYTKSDAEELISWYLEYEEKSAQKSIENLTMNK